MPLVSGIVVNIKMTDTIHTELKKKNVPDTPNPSIMTKIIYYHTCKIVSNKGSSVLKK